MSGECEAVHRALSLSLSNFSSKVSKDFENGRTEANVVKKLKSPKRSTGERTLCAATAT